MGMIEDMASVISKVFGLKQQKKLTEALWELDDMVRQKFQLNNGFPQKKLSNYSVLVLWSK
jgi:hypothetical protein